jgi:hypothetical protein
MYAFAPRVFGCKVGGEASAAAPADGRRFANGTKVGLVDQVHDGLSVDRFQARLIQVRTTKPGQAFAAWSL